VRTVAAVADGLASLLTGEGALITGSEAEAWAVGDLVPSAVAHPASVEELAGVMERAASRGWAVVPAGAGSWLDGGGPPDRLDVVVTTSRLGGVEAYEPGDLTLTAGAGLSVEELRRETEAHGQWFPQDPPGAARGTLGGLVATGLPGPLRSGFGRPRDQVLGLTVVTGDGRVLRPGGRVVKNVAGYDLVRLLVGSRGTLGVLAGASIRLFPLPEREVSLVYRASRAGDLVDVSRKLATAPVTAASLQLLSPLPGDQPEGGAAVVARVLGRSEEVSGTCRLLQRSAGRAADGELEGDASRDLHRSVEDGGGRGEVELCLSLAPARLAELLGLADELSGALCSAGGRELRRRVDLGSGVLELDLVGIPEEPAACAGPLGEARERLRAQGGGLGLLRAPPEVFGEIGSAEPFGARRRLSEGLKRAFDPAGVLVPGRGIS